MVHTYIKELACPTQDNTCYLYQQHNHYSIHYILLPVAQHHPRVSLATVHYDVASTASSPLSTHHHSLGQHPRQFIMSEQLVCTIIIGVIQIGLSVAAMIQCHFTRRAGNPHVELQAL
ncbi:hypothetical protein MN608_08353 [Microdochium nivale]|nr:hypothetical protein MN608_08353 [Microdochium nivale]